MRVTATFSYITGYSSYLLVTAVLLLTLLVINGYAAAIVGLLPHDRKVFPTHAPDDAFHGPKTRSAWPQAVAAAFCLVYVLSGKRR